MPTFDTTTALLLMAVLLIAVTLAVLAGTGIARLFSAASRDTERRG